MTNATAPRCGQHCDKLAIAVVNGTPLCVDCYYKFEVARTLGARLAIINMNYAAAEMDHITGLRNFTPRMQVPDIPKGPVILNNIKIDNSVVGWINTGNIETVDVSISYLEHSGNKDISAALKILTEAIVNNAHVSSSAKSNMLDQVAYLSEQAANAAKDRKPGMIVATLGHRAKQPERFQLSRVHGAKLNRS